MIKTIVNFQSSEYRKDVKRIQKVFGKKRVRQLLGRGARVVKKEVKDRVPVKEGKLQKSIQTLRFRNTNAVIVGPNYGYPDYARHAHLINNGWITSSGKKVPGEFFIERGYKASIGEAEKRIEQAFRKEAKNLA